MQNTYVCVCVSVCVCVCVCARARARAHAREMSGHKHSCVCQPWSRTPCTMRQPATLCARYTHLFYKGYVTTADTRMSVYARSFRVCVCARTHTPATLCARYTHLFFFRVHQASTLKNLWCYARCDSSFFRLFYFRMCSVLRVAHTRKHAYAKTRIYSCMHVCVCVCIFACILV
jgi:hypothetical protein